MKYCTFILVLALSGCASNTREKPYVREVYDAWVGKPVSLLESVWGQPQGKEVWSNGTLIYTYKHFGSTKQIIWSPSFGRYGPMPMQMGGDYYCISHFKVGKDHYIKSWWMDKGSTCMTAKAPPGMVTPSHTTNKRVKQDNTLDNNEIVNLFKGKTVEGYHVKKHFWFKRYFSPDGKLLGYRKKKGIRTGNWTVQNNRLCIQWKNRQQSCKVIIRESGKINQYKVTKSEKLKLRIEYKNFSHGNLIDNSL